MVLGDSLGLIVYPYFADLLPDRYVGYTGKVGSTTGWALEQLQNQQAAGTTIPNVVVISSGTNDEYLADFEQDAPKILALLGTERCVVWANIARPLASGDDPALINTYLQTITANSPTRTVPTLAPRPSPQQSKAALHSTRTLCRPRNSHCRKVFSTASCRTPAMLSRVDASSHGNPQRFRSADLGVRPATAR
jgi:hypothetical protein